MVLAQPVYPPLRMVPDGLGIFFGLCHQLVALAQKPAQAAIDEARLVPRGFASLGGLNGLVNQCVRVVGRTTLVPTKCQRYTQQRIGFGWGRPLGQLLAQGLGTTKIAQRMEAQRLNAGPQGTFNIFQSGRHGLAVSNRH